MRFTEKTQKGLIKKFHVILGQAKIDARGKKSILGAYGVEHTKDLSCDELIELCTKLKELGQPKAKEKDLARKRLMGSIGGWMKKADIPGDAEMIKRIACRASGYSDFNAIPLERLRSLYYAFLNKQKDETKVKLISSVKELISTVSIN